MPPTLSKPSGFAPTTLAFITIGALMTVWSGIWYSYLRNHASGDGIGNYLCMGCFITGLVLLVIGMTAGPMARWSRQAELPPDNPPTASTAPQGVTSRRV